MTCPHCHEEIPAPKGGRPRTAAPRCPCGANTATRAAARGWECCRAAGCAPGPARAYWGSGTPLWVAVWDDEEHVCEAFFRASDYSAACDTIRDEMPEVTGIVRAVNVTGKIKDIKQ